MLTLCIGPERCRDEKGRADGHPQDLPGTGTWVGAQNGPQRNPSTPPAHIRGTILSTGTGVGLFSLPPQKCWGSAVPLEPGPGVGTVPQVLVS